MRHLKKDKKLGRKSPHRLALFNNLVTALLTYGRIETTEAKAKMLRAFADSTITWGTSVSALIAKGDSATPTALVRDRMAQKAPGISGPRTPTHSAATCCGRPPA